MSRISSAFRSFFSILFGGSLPEDIAREFGFVRKSGAAPAPKAAAPAFQPADGALQLLGILQRDARLIDFFMEDIAAYSDDQVGAAVRNVHEQCKASLTRYVKLSPVIDGVEGAFTRLDSAGPLAKDAAAVKLLGNVPADGKVGGGTLRHRGWRAEKIDLPALLAKQNTSILAPAELEVE